MISPQPAYLSLGSSGFGGGAVDHSPKQHGRKIVSSELGAARVGKGVRDFHLRSMGARGREVILRTCPDLVRHNNAYIHFTLHTSTRMWNTTAGA